MNYIKAIKEYLYTFLSNDDYLINTFKYITLFLKGDYENELIREFTQHVNENKIAKLCKKVFSDVRKQYKTKYEFEEITENGLKYKIIPKNFLLYRSYASNSTPFPRNRAQMWVGFSFIDVVGYATPQDITFEEKDLTFTSENYCKLLGNVSTYRTKKELKLLDMGSVNTVKSLIEILQRDNKKDVLRGLVEGWKIIIKNDEEIVNRKSEYEGDEKFADWLYESGYDGYIGYDLPGLHDECCISRDKSLEDIEEPVKGMGLKFPLHLLNAFPISQIVPLCQDPFTKINYELTLN